MKSYAEAAKQQESQKGPPVGTIRSLEKSSPENPLECGILHLYRGVEDSKRSSNHDNNNTVLSEPQDDDSVMLCTLGVPSDMSTPEFLKFVSPVDPFVSHYRVIR